MADEKKTIPSVFANEEHCGYCGSKDHTRDACKDLAEAYAAMCRRRKKAEALSPSQQYASNLDAFQPKLYTSPAEVLKSPTAHSLLQLEPGTECPICMSKVVSIESLGAFGWRCHCAGNCEYSGPQADHIEQSVELWLEEQRAQAAQEIQDVRIPFVPTSLFQLAKDRVLKTHASLLSQLKDT